MKIRRIVDKAVSGLGPLATLVVAVGDYHKGVAAGAAFLAYGYDFWADVKRSAQELKGERIAKIETELRAFREHSLVITGQQDKPMVLRVTVHVVHETSLLQLTDYIGGKKNGKGRMLPKTSGVVGEALRTEDVAGMERDASQDSDEYMADLVKNWGMTSTDAGRVERFQRSFIAAPILGEKGPVGVLFADSSVAGLLSSEHVAKLLVSTQSRLLDLVEKGSDGKSKSLPTSGS